MQKLEASYQKGGSLVEGPEGTVPPRELQGRAWQKSKAAGTCSMAASMYIIPTLGPKVHNHDLLWAIWSPRADRHISDIHEEAANTLRTMATLVRGMSW